jgi:hypothetical protein
MIGELLMLPLRVSARATSLALRGTEQVAARAAAVAMRAATIIRPGHRDFAAETSKTPASEPLSPRRTTPQSRRTPAAAPPTAAAESITESPASAQEPIQIPEDAFSEPPEPQHVSEEPTLVEEFAEPGAEEGAGPSVIVDEPWKGYSQMHADDVIQRVERASQAELAAISLYENANRRRQTILTAVERQLELASRGGSRD